MGLRIHERLRLGVVLRRPPFDQVAREREGSAGETDERDVKFADEVLYGLDDEGDITFGLQLHEPSDIGLLPDRSLDHRTDPRLDLKLHAHALQLDDDVAEEHRRVDAQPSHGLQRDLGRDLGITAHLEHRMPVTDGPVLRQAPSGLAHEPDRCVIDGPTTGSLEERVSHPCSVAAASLHDVRGSPHVENRCRVGVVAKAF